MEIPDFVGHIVERLQLHGHTAFVVGGAVRDMHMARAVTDWDIATSAGREEIMAVFADTRSFSLKHETVSLVHENRCYEVTPFRGEGKRDLETDLAHRDFTIDAMAYNPARKELVDPFGGRKDIRKRLVKCVGNPADRFREDPLRLLRAVRLAAELGFRTEPETLEEISRSAQAINTVAKERIREEWMKVLLSPRPSRGIHLMRNTNLLGQVLPELLEGVGRRQNPRHHRYTVYKHILETIDRVEAEPVLRLTALLHDIAKPRVREKIAGKFRFYGHEKAGAALAQEILERLKFDNGTISLVTHLIANHMRDLDYHPGWTDGAVRRLIRAVGAEHIGLFFRFRDADLEAHGVQDEKQALFPHLKDRVQEMLSRPLAAKSRDLAIDGHRVMELLGLSPGPEVGRILNLLLEKVTDDPELNCEERLVAMLKGMKVEYD